MKHSLHWKTARRWKTSGQALILIILTFFGLLFFLGLMVDLGQIFLAKGYLRRASDSAALAAAAQFRTDASNPALTLANMTNAAKEAAKMNGINEALVVVETCATSKVSNPPDGDTVLCAEPSGIPQKLVRVTITLEYPMSFLQLMGITHVELKESSISEAASMDVVLVIDTSESMSWDLRGRSQPIGADPKDPHYCNTKSLPDADVCQPFTDVKEAALTFASKILNKSATEEEDRLSIVSFADGWNNAPLGTYVLQGWTRNINDATAKINSMRVYDPPYSWTQGADYPDPMPLGPVRMYDVDGTYLKMKCLSEAAKDEPKYYSACGTTNIGGALTLAGSQFAIDKRPQALWVVVLLTDGAADATFGTYEDRFGISGDPHKPYVASIDPAVFEPNLPFGFCPSGDWIASGHLCQDDIAGNYHPPSNGAYDANDYAIDQGKYVACPAVLASPATTCSPIKGQGAIIFTIGLGGEIVKMDGSGTKPYGGTLLRYLASVGDDGNPDNSNPCSAAPASTDWTISCGNYFYAQENGTDLQAIFEKIYSRIFTRLTV
jgi:Flp pilus assembly protein TadG